MQGCGDNEEAHLGARHKQFSLEIKTGSFLKHQTEFTNDFKRDFRDIQVVELSHGGLDQGEED